MIWSPLNVTETGVREVLKLPTRNIEKIAIFAFGVSFLSIILVLVVLIPTPTTAQFFAFRLTLALSAAGIGALLPGFLRLEVSLPLQGGIRAGGALAMFASVWFVNPATFGIEVQPPKEDAGVLINEFLNLTDSYDHLAAYSLFSKFLKNRINNTSYISMGKQVRDPLGALRTRVLVSSSATDEVNGMRGAFVINIYQSKFSITEDVWVEVVATVAENGKWRITNYTVNRCVPPFCYPVASLLQ
jgi:hypothetical protein